MRKSKYIYKYLIGKTIKIISMPGDPAESDYTGRSGVVKKVVQDCYGEEQLWGTWGGIAIYPNHDEYEVLSEDVNGQQ